MSDDLLQIVVRAMQSAPWGTIDKIATSTGIPYMTISRIKCGVTKNPRWKTLKLIADYFAQIPQSEVDRERVAGELAAITGKIPQSENS